MYRSLSISNLIYAAAAVAVLLTANGCGEQPRTPIGHTNMYEDATLRRMYDAADQRDAEALLPYATHDTAAYRQVFARLTGSMPDSLLLRPLTKLLADPVPQVMLEASWAIGQYRDTIALEALESAIRKATIPEIKAELLESIGKCAHNRAMAFLIRHEPNTPVEEAGKMWGIYRASLRGLLREEHLRVVVAHLQSKGVDTRLAAIHTLGRQTTLSLKPFASEITQSATKDPSAEVRHMAIKALAQAGADDVLLARIAQRDPDPTVRAAAIEGLLQPELAPAKEALTAALEDGQPWVAMTAAARLYHSRDTGFVYSLRSMALTSSVPEVRAAVVGAMLRLSPPKSPNASSQSAWQLYSDVMRRYPTAAHQLVMLRALGFVPSATDTLLALVHGPAPLSTAAAEALVSIAAISAPQRETVAAAARKVFAEGADGAVAVFAEAATTQPLRGLLAADTAVIALASDRFQNPGQVEIRNAVLRAERSLRGVAHTDIPPAHNHPIDWTVIQGIGRREVARIYSRGGYIAVELVVEDAPASVSNFVALAQKGFYNGRTAHRVVPGFVTQGGCPSGDGYHSVPYTLRSEFSPLRFGKGVVGLASAGPDTEGCQFFITHASTPHLDGRYTIIGAVTEGFERLASWSTGTVIDSVVVTTPAPAL